MNTYRRIVIKGLPKHYTFETMLYNQVVDMIIVQIELHFPRLYVSRIYYRHIKENQYHKLGNSKKPNYSYESVITSGKLPTIYFNTIERKNGNGGNWVEIRSFNFITKKTKKIFDTSNFKLVGNEKRAWISDLIGISSDEDDIFCVVAFMSAEKKFETATKKDFRVVNYYLCKLNIKSHDLERLTLLRGIFL